MRRRADPACAFAFKQGAFSLFLHGKSPHSHASKEKYVAKLARTFYLCSSAAALKGTLSCLASVEAIQTPTALAINRSQWGMRRRAGRKGPEKNFAGESADNALISHDSLPKMEEIGTNFRRFGSSRTHPGSADDASLKSPSARPKANAAFTRGVIREYLRAQSVGPEMVPQRLEKIDSAPGSGMAPEASNPQDLVRGTSGDAATGRGGRARRHKPQELQLLAPKSLKSLTHEQSLRQSALPLDPGPAVQAEPLLRQVGGLVSHLLRAVDPVAEIDVRQAESAGLLDMVENHEAAEGAAGVMRRIEGIDQRQPVRQPVGEANRVERAGALIVARRLAQAVFDELGVDVGVLDHHGEVERRHIGHAALGMASVEIGAEQGEMLVGRLRRDQVPDEIGVHAQRPALAFVGAEIVDQHPHRHAGPAALASGPVCDGLRAAEAGLGKEVVQRSGPLAHQMGEDLSFLLARQVRARRRRGQIELRGVAHFPGHAFPRSPRSILSLAALSPQRARAAICFTAAARL